MSVFINPVSQDPQCVRQILYLWGNNKNNSNKKKGVVIRKRPNNWTFLIYRPCLYICYFYNIFLCNGGVPSSNIFILRGHNLITVVVSVMIVFLCFVFFCPLSDVTDIWPIGDLWAGATECLGEGWDVQFQHVLLDGSVRSSPRTKARSTSVSSVVPSIEPRHVVADDLRSVWALILRNQVLWNLDGPDHILVWSRVQNDVCKNEVHQVTNISCGGNIYIFSLNVQWHFSCHFDCLFYCIFLSVRPMFILFDILDYTLFTLLISSGKVLLLWSEILVW